MVRSVIYLLLLIIVFLSGMLLGIDREGEIISDEMMRQDITSPPAQVTATSDQEEIPNYVLDIDTNPHFTQKMASFLETGIKAFYEIIVEILYQISRMFF